MEARHNGERHARETERDGSLILATPVTLPDVLDVLIVGGGPFGTATAFRAKELGLTALVIDYDDLMKRIRDYAKDKQILPDYGGGDRMQFPQAGPLIARLQFAPIDKDQMCQEWKALYREHSVPAQIGIELTGLERDGESGRRSPGTTTSRSNRSIAPGTSCSPLAAACPGGSIFPAMWRASRSA